MGGRQVLEVLESTCSAGWDRCGTQIGEKKQNRGKHEKRTTRFSLNAVEQRKKRIFFANLLHISKNNITIE